MRIACCHARLFTMLECLNCALLPFVVLHLVSRRWTVYQARRWQISMGGAEPPKFPKITPFRKGPPLPPYKNFPHGGGHGPPSPPLSDGLAVYT